MKLQIEIELTEREEKMLLYDLRQLIERTSLVLASSNHPDAICTEGDWEYYGGLATKLWDSALASYSHQNGKEDICTKSGGGEGQSTSQNSEPSQV